MLNNSKCASRGVSKELDFARFPDPLDHILFLRLRSEISRTLAFLIRVLIDKLKNLRSEISREIATRTFENAIAFKFRHRIAKLAPRSDGV